MCFATTSEVSSDSLLSLFDFLFFCWHFLSIPHAMLCLFSARAARWLVVFVPLLLPLIFFSRALDVDVDNPTTGRASLVAIAKAAGVTNPFVTYQQVTPATVALLCLMDETKGSDKIASVMSLEGWRFPSGGPFRCLCRERARRIIHLPCYTCL